MGLGGWGAGELGVWMGGSSSVCSIVPYVGIDSFCASMSLYVVRGRACIDLGGLSRGVQAVWQYGDIPSRMNIPQRLASLNRFREKRKERNYDKKIRYTVRKEVAQRYEWLPMLLACFEEYCFYKTRTLSLPLSGIRAHLAGFFWGPECNASADSSLPPGRQKRGMRQRGGLGEGEGVRGWRWACP